MKIAFFSTKSYDREFFSSEPSGNKHEIRYIDSPLNKDTAVLVKDATAVCVFVNDKLDAETLQKLSEYGIRLILLRCAGYNNVDTDAARLYGLVIMRVPSYSPEAIAEHAMALILTLNRKTHKAYNRIRENNFSLEHLTGFNLHGKTVGVIGTGKTGAAFCKIVKGFGCKVIAFDVTVSQEMQHEGVEYTSLKNIWERSDIISLHCPLTSETKYLINEKSISLMKDNVMLINTSRGAVINTLHIIEALKKGKIGYLGIDVYEQEEKLFFRDLSDSIIQDEMISRLMSFPTVLITAHQGFFTKEALQQIALITYRNIEDFEKGISSENKIK